MKTAQKIYMMKVAYVKSKDNAILEQSTVIKGKHKDTYRLVYSVGCPALERLTLRNGSSDSAKNNIFPYITHPHKFEELGLRVFSTNKQVKLSS